MSSINNALLASGALKAQPHAVLVASVADGAEEIARLKRDLQAAKGALRSLMNEANGFVSIAKKDADWVAIWGVTNMNCIRLRLAEAAECLAALEATK